MRLYLDASAIIYSVEGRETVKAAILSRLRSIEEDGGDFVTSSMARLEVRVLPLRSGNADLLATYEGFLSRQVLTVAPIDDAIIDRATDLRARYGFRTPDAIHLATAITHGADAFVTGDRRLSRCSEIPVELVDPAADEA